MNFSAQQHKYYCGIDLHARKMYVCVVNQQGKVQVHQNIDTDPALFLELISPTRRMSSSGWNASSAGIGWPISVSPSNSPSSSGTPCICGQSMAARPRTTKSIPIKSPACSKAVISPSPMPIRQNGGPSAIFCDGGCTYRGGVVSSLPISRTPTPNTTYQNSTRN